MRFGDLVTVDSNYDVFYINTYFDGLNQWISGVCRWRRNNIRSSDIFQTYISIRDCFPSDTTPLELPLVLHSHKSLIFPCYRVNVIDIRTVEVLSLTS